MYTFDYQITDDLRALWDIELDIYHYFRALCQKHRLSFFAIGGTCLGAARHKGFIPWDDDMDFAMPFDDYMKFLDVAAKECSYPYYSQSFLTDPEHGGITLSRLRRSDTTGCTKWEFEHIGQYYDKYPDYNLGIWIDIFPLCYIPEEDDERQQQKSQIMDVWRAIRGYSAYAAQRDGLNRVKDEYYSYIKDYERYSKNYTLAQMKALYTERCGMNKSPTPMIGLTTLKTFQPAWMWQSEWFSSVIDMPFENTTVPVPIEYDKLLTHCYHDWHTPVINAAAHELFIYDTNTPYTIKFSK